MIWQEALKLLITLIAPLIGFAGAWLATGWTLKRFYKERSWERKATAYTVVFEGLHDMLEWHSEQFDAAIVREKVPADRLVELNARYRKARDEVRRRIAAETWLLDEEVAEVISQLWVNLQKQETTWEGQLDEGYGYIANAQKKIRTIARADLEIAKPRRTSVAS